MGEDACGWRREPDIRITGTRGFHQVFSCLDSSGSPGRRGPMMAFMVHLKTVSHLRGRCDRIAKVTFRGRMTCWPSTVPSPDLVCASGSPKKLVVLSLEMETHRTKKCFWNIQIYFFLIPKNILQPPHYTHLGYLPSFYL